MLCLYQKFPEPQSQELIRLQTKKIKNKETFNILILLDERKNNFNIFHHYGGLYNFIETQEKHRNARKSGRKSQCWVFARHSHRRMITYQGIFSHPMVYPGGVDSRNTNGQDILEIVSGDRHNPVYIPLAHNVDIEPLQKNWCNRYCKFHGYILIEIASLMELKKLATNLENEQPQSWKVCG